MRICTFASGSRGNCTLVSIDGRHFLVDAGISMRRICSNLATFSLKVTDLDAIFITHLHSDHISGLAMLCKYYSVPVYAPRSTAAHLLVSLSCSREHIHILSSGECIHFSGVAVSSFATSHDTEESVGYRFEGKKTFALATDTGVVTDTVFKGLCGAHAVLIESNHDVEMLKYGPYPYHLKKRILSPKGHLSNDDCAKLARSLSEGGTQYIVLGHLSRENNTPGKALAAVNCLLSGSDTHIYIAPESEPLTIELGGEC